MSDMNAAPDPAETDNRKQPYEHPQLRQVGSVADLTTGTGLSGGEGLGYS